jgi:hypothetical protein
LWDPHTGLKPSELDGYASDGDLMMGNDLPSDAENEAVDLMVEMMRDLDDNDPHDTEWLPAYEQRKLEARKTGMLSYFMT